MEAVILNVPRAFRSTDQIRRSDYQQIGDGMEPSYMSLKCVIVYCLCLVSIFSGIAALAYEYTILGSLLVLAVPTSGCLYWPLKSLYWSRYCSCLRRICCFTSVDIVTPHQPTPPQVLADSPTPKQVLADSPTPQQVLADSPTPQQVLADSPTPQQVLADSPTPQQVLADSPMPQQVLADSPMPQQILADSSMPVQVLADSPTLQQALTDSPTPPKYPSDVEQPILDPLKDE